jgi:hypothetical protein
MAAPKTIADFTSALTALKAKYPSSYPLIVRAKDLGGTSTLPRFVVEWAFTNGVVSGGASDDAVGWNPSTHQFVFEPTVPGFQQAISYVAMLYSKKLLDPEFLTTDMNRLVAQLKAGQSFAVVDYEGGLAGYGPAQQAAGGHLVPIAVPPATAGSPAYIGVQGAPISAAGTVLSAKLSGDTLQRVLHILNYLYSNEFHRVLYQNPAVYKNGRYSAGIINSDPKINGTYIPWSLSQGFRAWFLYAYPPDSAYGIFRHAADAGKYAMIKPAPALPFTTQQTQTLARLQTAVNNVWNSAIEQIVVGQRPVSALASLIQQARAAGGDQMASIYNTVYKQYFKS